MVRTSGGQQSDRGTRNIGVRETTDDLGNGGLDPFGASLSVAVRDAPAGAVVAADGTFKIPSLRNVEPSPRRTSTRAARRPFTTWSTSTPAAATAAARPRNPIETRDGTVIGGLGVLNFNNVHQFFEAEAAKADLVAFLKALTDERVRIAAAPFDHPQIFVPNGHPGDRAPSPSSTDGPWIRSWRSRPPGGTAARSCPDSSGRTDGGPIDGPAVTGRGGPSGAPAARRRTESDSDR